MDDALLWRSVLKYVNIINKLLLFQACKNFYDDGVCKQECPPMQSYNPNKYKWEKNPDGKYAYGATCVKDCPEHLLKDNGACVRACPPKKKVKRMITVKGSLSTPKERK